MAKRASATARRQRPAIKGRSVARATTYRLDPHLQKGLALLGKLRRMSANQMVNEAVSGYLSLRTAAVETDLADMLRKVRAYRQADPGFESAIAKVAEAEARLANQDPVEGEAITTGPTQGRARDLVRG